MIRKRVLAQSTLASLVLLGVTVTPVAAQVPTSGLVAEWTLNGNANDTAGGFNGTLIGGTWTTGKISGAAALNGTGDHIETTVIPDGSALKPQSAYTISAWVKYSATGSNGGEIATMGDNYALRVQADGSVKTFFYDGSSWPKAISEEVNTKDGEWHHVLGEYNGSKLRVYVDGGHQREEAASGSITYVPGRSFKIGKHDSDSTHNFNGTIDQVRVYNRALNPQEIAALVAEGPPETDTFKVLTWNVRKCKRTSDSAKDCNRVADAIKTANPDVVLLSAVQYKTDADAITLRLGSPWKSYYAKAVQCTARCASEGQAIITRHDLALNADGTCPATVCAATDVLAANSYESQVVAKATVTIAGRAVTFFAIDQDHLSSSVREEQSKIARDWLAQFDEPRIGAGDFNESSPTAGGLKEWLTPTNQATGYDDDWDGSTKKVGYSGNAASVGRTKLSRLDHIISSEGAIGQVLPQQGRVWDMRDLSTTCSQVTVSIDSHATDPCATSYIDDKGVRPTDHVPLTAIFKFLQ